MSNARPCARDPGRRRKSGRWHRNWTHARSASMRPESSAFAVTRPVRLFQAIPRVLVIAAVATLLIIARQWAYVTIYGLYLDHRIDEARSSTAVQRFDIEGGRVVPKIAMRNDRVWFRVATGQDSTILAVVSPQDDAASAPAVPARYEIHIHQ